MKHFKVKQLKVTKRSNERVSVTAKLPIKPLPSKKPIKMPSSVRGIKERAQEKSVDIVAREAARQRYRTAHNVVLTSCADNLAQLNDHANMHVVTFPNGTVREIPAFTITSMGEPLGTTGVTVTRWVNGGMLPAPVLETTRGKVYHSEEARLMVRIIGEHQRSFRQYRKEHTEIKDTLFSELRRLREALFQTK